MILNRRQFVAVCAASTSFQRFAETVAPAFEFKYLLASSMYGYADLEKILPEVPQSGARALDIWPKIHGNQREQLDAMGEEKFTKLLGDYNVQLGCISQYKLGPFGLGEEMQLAKRLGCRTIVTGGRGPKGLLGSELKVAVLKFIEQMKPHLALAEETGITIAIENHANNLFESPDSLKWLVDLHRNRHLSVALAPYHLKQDPALIADLIKSLGNRMTVFYAWQHGMGCKEKLPKEQELLQLPGRGDLDFGPLVDALKSFGYSGWTEIFMHPVPRGVPILDSVAEVTTEINRSRLYLENLR